MSYLIDQHVHCSNQFIERLLRTLDQAMLIECIPQLVCEEFQADTALFVEMLTPEQLMVTSYIGDPELHSDQVEHWLHLVQRAIATEQPLLATIKDLQAQVLLNGLGCRIALVIPVQRQAQCSYAVCVTWKTHLAHEFDLAHAALVGRYVGLALANAERCVELQQQRSSSKQQARLTDRLAGMSRLTTVIAHEVNNPLQAIVNTLQLLSRPIEQAKRERYLAMATKEAERLARTIQRALALYQPAQDGRRAVALHTLLERVIEQVLPQSVAHHVTIERDFAHESLHVVGVVSHLREVFLSLLQNAIDASTPSSRIVLRTYLDTQHNTQDTQLAIVEVIDQGAGIPIEQLQTIFEPFYTTKSENTGMGLAICYDIIEHHAGQLTVSTSTKGTIFRVSLPIASTTEAQ